MQKKQYVIPVYFSANFFITFDRSNWRIIIRDAMDGTHPKVL